MGTAQATTTTAARPAEANRSRQLTVHSAHSQSGTQNTAASQRTPAEIPQTNPSTTINLLRPAITACTNRARLAVSPASAT